MNWYLEWQFATRERVKSKNWFALRLNNDDGCHLNMYVKPLRQNWRIRAIRFIVFCHLWDFNRRNCQHYRIPSLKHNKVWKRAQNESFFCSVGIILEKSKSESHQMIPTLIFDGRFLIKRFMYPLAVNMVKPQHKYRNRFLNICQIYNISKETKLHINFLNTI